MEKPSLVITGVSDKLVAIVALVELRCLVTAVERLMDDPARDTRDGVYAAIASAKSLYLSYRAQAMLSDWDKVIGK